MTRHSWKNPDPFVRHELNETRFQFDIGYDGIWRSAWVMGMSMGMEHEKRMETFSSDIMLVLDSCRDYGHFYVSQACTLRHPCYSPCPVRKKIFASSVITLLLDWFEVTNYTT
jgi:hypothetical protein